MAKVYNPPSNIKVPSLSDFIIPRFDHKAYETANQNYIAEVKEYLKAWADKPSFGEVISFQVADGYAQYLVVNLKPVTLVHLPLGDAWHYEGASKLTAKNVLDSIKRKKSLEEIFGNTK